MEATVDEVGRIVLPKPLRDRLRLTPGTKVDVSEYGDGLHVTPVSRLTCGCQGRAHRINACWGRGGSTRWTAVIPATCCER